MESTPRRLPSALGRRVRPAALPPPPPPTAAERDELYRETALFNDLCVFVEIVRSYRAHSERLNHEQPSADELLDHFSSY